MRFLALHMLLISVIWSTPSFGQVYQDTDPLLRDKKVERIEHGFKFAEGPVADRSGNLYFSDVLGNKTYFLTTGGDLSVFLDDTEWGNGLAIRGDQLYVCHAKASKVSRYSIADGSEEVLAADFEGKPFNGPNDLWVTKEGGVYFTDPNYSNNREAGPEVVYFIAPDGKVSVATDDVIRPNGLAFDGRNLFVVDHGAKKTWKFRISKDGSLKGKRLFVAITGDGATSDHNGNLYITNLQNSSVDAFDKEAKLIVQIPVPEVPSNVTFAGENGNELYITARSSIYRITTNVKGRTND